MNTNEAAEKWNCDRNTVAEWCRNRNIADADKKDGFRWVIPDNARRPIDRRLQKEILWRILEVKNGNSRKLDLTTWGIDSSDNQRCIESLYPQLINKTNEKSPAPVAAIDELMITEAGFELLGRRQQKEKLNTPKVLMWSSECVGLFAAAFLKSLW